MIKAMFYLPHCDNDGSDLIPLISELEDALAIEFGGITFVGDVRGKYKTKSGKLVEDLCAVYSVVIGEGDIDKLKRLIADVFKAKTTQEAIYFEAHV